MSKLSSQITAANLALDTTRSRGRRANALWTLYTTLTYLVFLLIIVLVLGPQNWSIYHYAALVGSPLLIYGVRRSIRLFFDWRINRHQSNVNRLTKQREAKINDLKKATKYDSTQELLHKYGGGPAAKTPSRQPPASKKDATSKKQPSKVQPQRTGIPPPPTANIPGRQFSSPVQVQPQVGSHPNSPTHGQSPLAISALTHSPADISPESPGFAPNAFTQNQPLNTAYEQTPHWYDRILDVLLGDDENAAKNRLVLLCSQCRLVNGQAPPGVRTLEELGRWRCSSCGAWNGGESEGAKVVEQITGKPPHGDSEDDLPHTPISKEVVPEEVDTNGDGSTGHEGLDDSGLSQRVTRSATKRGSFESLE